MFILSDDILLNIIKIYNNYYIICKKDNEELNKLIFSKKIHLLYKKINHTPMCNILYIKNINIKICSYHNNISFDLVKNIISQLNYFENNYSNNYSNSDYDIIDSSMVLLKNNKYDEGHHIHYTNLKKNEYMLRFILNKYNYKLINFCCGGNGCKIVKCFNI